MLNFICYLSVFLIVKLGLYFICTRSDCRLNDHFRWRTCPVSWKSSLFVLGAILIVRIENATDFHHLHDRVLISSINLFIVGIARWHFPGTEHDHAPEHNITVDISGLRRRWEHSNDRGLCHSHQTRDFRLECFFCGLPYCSSFIINGSRY